MTAKCFSKGSECPKLEAGKLRLYGMRFCPFTERALLVMAAKNIPHEVVNINLKDKPEWLFTKSPLGKIPVLEQDSKIILDSIIVSDYLDAAYPDNKLTPDPYLHARDKMLMEHFGKVTLPMSKVSRGGTYAFEAWNEFQTGVEEFEKALEQRKTNFFEGNKVGMLDYMLWPWFERIPVIEALNPSLDSFSTEKFPLISKWIDRMKSDPVVRKVAVKPQLHVEFIESTKTGEPDYDKGL